MFDRGRSVDNTAAFVNEHAHRLRALVGQPVVSTWCAWDGAANGWFADEAVSIQFPETRMEVVCWKLGEIVLSWNELDLASRPAWVADWGPNFALEWRKNALDELNDVLGQVVAGVNVVECLFSGTTSEDRIRRTNIGRSVELWFLSGIELILERGVCLIFNAMDQNGVSIHPPAGPDVRRVSIA